MMRHHALVRKQRPSEPNVNPKILTWLIEVTTGSFSVAGIIFG
ncbi:hypothetical protein BV133_1656 [Blastochloris viridis]|uniref:Uncharacterized protein n=1 Tax=Blastochloris viridis TaxID=1079 RepID=A0A182D1D8_BLAVI|nr:hypothetical protein BV133_1656 [Blastochloris viridis]